MKRIHDFVGKTNEAVNAINWAAEPPVKHFDAQRKRSAIPSGNQAAALGAGAVKKLEMIHMLTVFSY